MKRVSFLIKRNTKLFFKDKGMFFTSLITPGILLMLYALFLSNVYRDSFIAGFPEGFLPSEELIRGLVSGQLISSLLAVSCVTVAFSAGFLSVQDKVNGTVKDFRISAVPSSSLSLAYYLSSLLSTLLICFVATGLCLAYVAATGWFLSVSDVLLLCLDVLLLVFFGTALSSLVNFFLSTQGQMSAVGTVISACYGFICGAYMPISSFGAGLRDLLSFLPGTYGTSLLRNHALQGVLAEMEAQGMPLAVTDSLRDLTDCNLYFFEHAVSVPLMYLILGGVVVLLVLAYVLLNTFKKHR